MSEPQSYDDSVIMSALLRRIAQGDERAFTQLFDRYRPRIYTIGLKLTRSEHHAEEMVQDLFLRLWMMREDLPGIANFDAYLFTITRNAAIKAIKDTLRRKEIENTGNDRLSFETGLEHLLEAKEYSQMLARAVGFLPPQQMKVYQLMKVQGYKREEVAEMLALSPLTVKTHLAAAMRALRAYLVANMDLNAILLACWVSENLIQALVH